MSNPIAAAALLLSTVCIPSQAGERIAFQVGESDLSCSHFLYPPRSEKEWEILGVVVRSPELERTHERYCMHFQLGHGRDCAGLVEDLREQAQSNHQMLEGEISEDGEGLILTDRAGKLLILSRSSSHDECYFR